MLRTVPFADHDPPFITADAQNLAVLHPAVITRKILNHAAEPAIAVPPARHLFVRPSRRPIEGFSARRRPQRLVADQQSRGHILRPRHQQRRIELFAQPAGKADMIRVHMSADDAGDGAAAQDAGQRPAPAFARHIRGQTGVDNGPAVSILDGVEIDVV
ncbi:hypothetical protein D3C73_948560 [compost metagenome]